MAISEEQDRAISLTREKMAALSNENFVASMNVRGVFSTAQMLIGMLPDEARKQLIASLKTEFPADFAEPETK
jgi:hypothetical protein